MVSKASLWQALRRVSGFHIYRTPPRGTDLYSDLQAALPQFIPQIVFDVGANVGQSTADFLNRFPDAQVHAFEPGPRAVAELRAAFGHNPRVTIHELALSRSVGTGQMKLPTATVNARLTRGSGTPVLLDQLDDVCERIGVKRIGFLKIDTEGHDLAVLEGGSKLLASAAVDMVQVEAGMNPENRLHARFEDLKALLESFDYRLFGLYEQMPEFPSKQQHLRRTNPVFMSRSLIEKALRC